MVSVLCANFGFRGAALGDPYKVRRLYTVDTSNIESFEITPGGTGHLKIYLTFKREMGSPDLGYEWGLEILSSVGFVELGEGREGEEHRLFVFLRASNEPEKICAHYEKAVYDRSGMLITPLKEIPQLVFKYGDPYPFGAPAYSRDRSRWMSATEGVHLNVANLDNEQQMIANHFGEVSTAELETIVASCTSRLERGAYSPLEGLKIASLLVEIALQPDSELLPVRKVRGFILDYVETTLRSIDPPNPSELFTMLSALKMLSIRMETTKVDSRTKKFQQSIERSLRELLGKVWDYGNVDSAVSLARLLYEHPRILEKTFALQVKALVLTAMFPAYLNPGSQ